MKQSRARQTTSNATKTHGTDANQASVLLTPARTGGSEMTDARAHHQSGTYPTGGLLSLGRELFASLSQEQLDPLFTDAKQRYLSERDCDVDGREGDNAGRSVGTAGCHPLFVSS